MSRRIYNVDVDTLIIIAPLAEPPTDSLAFRSVTSTANDKLKLSVLIEVTNISKDLYYSYLKNRGLLDYVEQLITEEEREDAIRLDSQNNYPLTVVTDRVSFDNFLKILGQIRFLRNL